MGFEPIIFHMELFFFDSLQPMINTFLAYEITLHIPQQNSLCTSSKVSSLVLELESSRQEFAIGLYHDSVPTFMIYL